MPYTKFIELLIPTISTFLSVYVESALTEHGHLIAWSAASVVLLLSILILSLLWLEIQKIGFFDERFLMLGDWIEYLNKEGQSHVSTFTIEYSALTDSFFISGETWDISTLRLYGEWSSIAVSFPERHRMYYIHKAKIVGHTGDVSGLTRLRFIYRNRRYNEGSGYLLDDDSNMTRVDFEFEKIRQEDIVSCLGKDRIDTRQDKEAYLAHCFSNYMRPAYVSEVTNESQGANP
jgi:hypothetical protein